MALTGWATHVIQWSLQNEMFLHTIKNDLSTDCFLQLESMKVESLVIADQHVAVNTFSGLVHTARQTMGVGRTLRR